MSTRMSSDTNTEPKNKNVFNAEPANSPGDFTITTFTATERLFGQPYMLAL